MDRRPLTSRSSTWAKGAAKILAQYNVSPNFISILSVVFSIFSFLFFYIAAENKIFIFLAALCMQCRLLCNLFDGMVAIEHNKKSKYGNLFNDIPDRFADVFIIMGAGYYAAHNPVFNFKILEIAWINAILAVLTAYIRVLGVTVGAPMIFSGVMAKPQRMAILTLAAVLTLFLNNVPFFYGALVLMLLGQCLTIFTRIKLITKEIKAN